MESLEGLAAHMRLDREKAVAALADAVREGQLPLVTRPTSCLWPLVPPPLHEAVTQARGGGRASWNRPWKSGWPTVAAVAHGKACTASA
jgi:hypothetical protein